MICSSCGIKKDPEIKEIYPFPDDGIVDDKAIGPLIRIKVAGHPFRIASVCHQCFHKLDPDMWISQAQWESEPRRIVFENLPPEELDAKAKTS